MSALRLEGRRRGLISKSAPQTVEGWLTRKSGTAPPGGVVGHQVLSEVMHLGYGVAWGALYGALLGPRPHFVRWGLGFALAQWALGFTGYLPALHITPPARDTGARENGLNLLAHAVYGVVTALFALELTRQEEQTSPRQWERFHRSVG
jgi:hypothetical protein